MIKITAILRRVSLLATGLFTLGVAQAQPLQEAESLFENGREKLAASQGKEAIELFKQACLIEGQDRQLSAACTAVFQYYRDGSTGLKGEPESVRITPDFISFLNFSQRACEAGHKAGCYNALSYAQEGETLQDYQMQANYLGKLCDLGQGSSCQLLGILWASDKLGQPSPGLSRKAFGKGCETGLASACAVYRDLLQKGVGGPKDMEAAFVANYGACSEEDPFSDDYCIGAADFILTYGDDIEEENIQLMGFVERACNFGSAEGCGWYAEELEYTEVPHNIEKAKEIRQLACRYGDQDYCDAE